MAGEARILLLAGTGEAARLADGLAARPRIDLIVSLAGATARPKPLPGRVRSGGFGGAEGLAHVLDAERVAVLVDATHPYAARIAAHADEAARATGVPRLKLVRPPWRPRPGDAWIEVDDETAAAVRARELGRRPLVTLGARGGARFQAAGFEAVTARAIEPPAPAMGPVRWIAGRPPFAAAAERTLFQSLGIDVLVTRNAGGGATRAKLDAARVLGLPVVVIRRPEPPPGPCVASVAAALAWVDQTLASRST